MEKYAHEENIRRFERELRTETDPERRAVLESLLHEERVQLERVRKERGERR